ncbi:hypothetical protein S21ZY_144 [Pseudomonas phage ZY21]|nr:hypothetical protein S21ZY_144 [Pseudomonas phage ZY21]
MGSIGTVVVLIYATTFLWNICFPCKTAARD